MQYSRPRFAAILLGLALAGAAPPGKPNPYAERFAQLDRDHDGAVEREEWPLAPESFDVVDRDQDGRLSAEELLTPNTPPEPRRQERAAAASEALPPALRRPTSPRDPIAVLLDTWSPESTPPAQSRFRAQDRDQDHRINRLEWTGLSSLFDHLDRNRDGVLSPNEWPGR